jgi:hypothetical protein
MGSEMLLIEGKISQRRKHMDDEEIEGLKRKSRFQVFTTGLLCFGSVIWAV